jgi:hypothetical protein
MNDGPSYREETRVRTEGRAMFSPSRSHPFHSHDGHEVKARGEPATNIVTLMVSRDPQDGHEFRACGAIAHMSSA